MKNARLAGQHIRDGAAFGSELTKTFVSSRTQHRRALHDNFKSINRVEIFCKIHFRPQGSTWVAELKYLLIKLTFKFIYWLSVNIRDPTEVTYPDPVLSLEANSDEVTSAWSFIVRILNSMSWDLKADTLSTFKRFNFNRIAKFHYLDGHKNQWQRKVKVKAIYCPHNMIWTLRHIPD